MTQPKDKAGLLAWLQQEQVYWEALLHEVSEEDMLLPGVTEDWTFKDVVAHLTGWRKRTVARFIGALRGTEPPPPEWPAELGEEVPAVNGWMYRASYARPLAEVLAESRGVWQQLGEVVAALPEDDLFTPGRFAWIGDEALGPANLGWSFEHLHEHGDQIEAWLARLRSEGRPGSAVP